MRVRFERERGTRVHVLHSAQAIRNSTILLLVQALFGTRGLTIFVPSKAFRYRFAVDRFAQLAKGVERDELVDGTRVEGAMGGISSRRVAELAQIMQHPVLGVSRSVGFPGKEAVNWLIRNR